MASRITGLASGLDVDEVVKTTMKAYQTKVDTTKQKKEIYEIKQKLYRDVISEGKKLFNNYFDLAKSDSILSSKNYITTTFQSGNENVATATALAGAIKDNYTVNVVSEAKVSSTTLTTDQLSKDFEIKNSNGASVLIKNSELSLLTEKEKALFINSKISSLGLTAVASDFITGITIKTAETGANQQFTITSGAIIDSYFAPDSIVSGKSEETFTVDSLINATAKDIEFTLGTSKISIKASELKAATNALDTQIATKTAELVGLNGAELTAKQAEITSLETDRANVVATTIDSKLSSIGLTASKSGTNNDIVIKSKNGTDLFDYSLGKVIDAHVDSATATAVTYKNGSDLKGTVKNSSGTVYFGYDLADIPAGGINLTANSNKVILDGVQFSINSVGTTTVNGKTDATAAKDKIVKFVNDYNTYIEKLNKLTTDKHDRSYNPLTADQKKEMSETEIKLWNERVEKGQLSRDGDITRIVNDLKNAMAASVKGSGITLEKIGITPVDDYTTKNGMFTVNEDKLTAALESDPNSIIKLFTSPKPTDDTLTTEAKRSMTGIGYRMQDILNSEFMYSSKSALIKKAGYEGTTYFTQSTMSKSITEYERKIADMEKNLKTKEQALYSKYANLETIMNKYNTQMSYLNAQMGTSVS